MQSENLIVYKENPYSDVKEKVQEDIKSVLKSAVTGLREQAQDGTKDMAGVFTKWVTDMNAAKLELITFLKSKAVIGPQAHTLFQMIEKQQLTFQTIIDKCILKVTDVKISDIDGLNAEQQQLVMAELCRYFGKGIKILTRVAKALEWTYISVIAVFLLYSFYKVFKSGKRLKKATKYAINISVGFTCVTIGSKLGGLIGALGGPIGVVVGLIIGGMIGGVIGSYCGKGIYSLVKTILFPTYKGGPGQPPIKGTEHIYGQPKIPGQDKIKNQTQLRGLLPRGQPKIPGADAAFGLPKLW